MSGYRYNYPSGTSMELYDLMKASSDVGVLRKIQSVYLRAKFGYLPEKISEITGLSASRITHIHSEYKKTGKDSLVLSKRGGRNHCYMNLKDEAKFLESFKEKASNGTIVEVRTLIKGYEEIVGRKVHKSMIYKLLDRNGWRKILPRPKHPNHKVEAIQAFKKTFLHWLPKQERRHG